jgi:hypothetical protein
MSRAAGLVSTRAARGRKDRRRGMRIGRTRFTLALLVAAASASALAVPARTDGAGGTAEFALARFLAPSVQPLHAYRALRHLSGQTEKGGMRATMTVWTELLGNGAFRYHVVNESGSDNTRNRVFRAILETERRSVASGECDMGDLTTSNYRFAPSGGAHHGLARIEMTPHRPHPMRIVGALFVRPEDGELVRVEGQMSKRPSFWTRRIDIVHRYATLGGARVPTSVDATAQVLFVGRYQFAMQWEYESVNGVRVGTPVPRMTQAEPSTLLARW